MKRFLVFVLLLSFALAMTACGSDTQETTPPTTTAPAPSVATEPVPETILTYEELTTADLWEINTVLSHFVDTGLKSFDRNTPTETDLFRFVQSNAYYHNRQKIHLSEDGQNYYITAEDVAATLQEYFDITVAQPLAMPEATSFANDAYFWPCADGAMATEFASITSLGYDSEVDLYEVGFDIYSPNDLFTTEIEGYYSFSHVQLASQEGLMYMGSGKAMISYQDGQCILYSLAVNE